MKCEIAPFIPRATALLAQMRNGRDVESTNSAFEDLGEIEASVRQAQAGTIAGISFQLGLIADRADHLESLTPESVTPEALQAKNDIIAMCRSINAALCSFMGIDANWSVAANYLGEGA